MEESLEDHLYLHRRGYLELIGTAYIVSFALPAVMNPHPTPCFPAVELWGWQAALYSWVPVTFALHGFAFFPVAFIPASSNVAFLVGVLLFAKKQYGWAAALSCLALAAMTCCGVWLPESPGGGPFRWPGGHLGMGFYLWWGAGFAFMVLALVSRDRSRRPGRDSIARPSSL